MAHEIEADFVSNWGNELTACRNCTSFLVEKDGYYCLEAKTTIPPDGHCDFFKALD